MTFYSVEIDLRLKDFNLQLSFESEARVIGLFGPSGCGKSTALRCVTGLHQAKGYIRCGSSVLLDSKERIDLDPAVRGVGYVPQNHCLFPHLNVRQNLLAARLGPTVDREQQKMRFKEVTGLLEIDALLNRRINQLSGGERQRIALGRALCAMPNLLVLDEPMASLDGNLRRRILPYLIRIRDELNLPMIVVSHNPLELQLLCHEIVVLSQGRAVAQGRPMQVFTDAKIYPGIASAFENILELRVLEQTPKQTLTRIAAAEGPDGVLVLPPLSVAHPGVVRVGIAANDLLIALQKPIGVSARNVLAGRITRIQPLRSASLITVLVEGTGNIHLAAELTANATEELRLAVGKKIFLFFKTNAAQVYL